MRRVSVRYSGRVQGVGFRATARAIALEEGVTGWVRNEPDGSVMLEAQAATTQLDAFLKALTRRMERHIASSSVQELGPVATERTFEIRR